MNKFILNLKTEKSAKAVYFCNSMSQAAIFLELLELIRVLKACTDFWVQQKKLQESSGNVTIVFDIDLALAVVSYVCIVIC